MDAPEYVPGHDLLADRIVVVTAAAGAGIGFAVAKKAVEEGATVVISDVHERRLDEAADALAELSGDRPVTSLCDVSDENQVQELLDAAVAAHGRIDVMVNNAGLGGDTPLVEMQDDEWERVLDITLTGAMRCTRAAMRIMGEQGHGVIVNNASVLGWRAQAGQSHYAAAKAGVMALTRCAAIEGVESGIRINCVAPSFATHPFLARTSSEELLAELAASEAYGRGAEPWEVANVVVFLASDYSSYMTGEVVSVSSQRA
ncbi:MAG: SDR family oxidoreductase [Acidimicrobiales bacterium]|mgnify:FL=1|jgi:3-oxoacyl-[acyl-carrier protein] reductase|nr:SDR family oxidoreductase [Actinomycetes bacterium]MDG1988963.1 SDR family oxidoreductase [Acidimicrobiales bacterium]HCW01631.1 short chain dehydrogenase [Acidimicrobiaceae bacterium]HJM72431.1 SDR family oxidoreductase [Acidimicrobiales bacterium]HJP24307.1 SDR family oxidoreductase [Acidimicrobiales bacterium]